MGTNSENPQSSPESEASHRYHPRKPSRSTRESTAVSGKPGDFLRFVGLRAVLTADLGQIRSHTEPPPPGTEGIGSRAFAGCNDSAPGPFLGAGPPGRRRIGPTRAVDPPGPSGNHVNRPTTGRIGKKRCDGRAPLPGLGTFPPPPGGRAGVGGRRTASPSLLRGEGRGGGPWHHPQPGGTGPGSSAGGCAVPDGGNISRITAAAMWSVSASSSGQSFGSGGWGDSVWSLGWRLGVAGGGGDSAAGRSVPAAGSGTGAVDASGLMGAFVSGSIIVAGSTPLRSFSKVSWAHRKRLRRASRRPSSRG